MRRAPRTDRTAEVKGAAVLTWRGARGRAAASRHRQPSRRRSCGRTLGQYHHRSSRPGCFDVCSNREHSGNPRGMARSRHGSPTPPRQPRNNAKTPAALLITQADRPPLRQRPPAVFANRCRGRLEVSTARRECRRARVDPHARGIQATSMTKRRAARPRSPRRSARRRRTWPTAQTSDLRALLFGYP